jgi:hypothetical protein
MKIKLSKEIEKNLILKPQILRHFETNDPTPQNIASYCAMVGVPIVSTYYYLITDNNRKELIKDLIRLCEFYDMEVDCEIT